MSKRGPIPKSPTLKLLTGNPGKRPVPKAVKATAGVPPMPSWLSKEAKAAWRRVVPELQRMGVLSVIDGDGLAAFCEASADIQRATIAINAEGLMLEVPVFARDTGRQVGTRKIRNPWCSIMTIASTRLKSFATEYGLTPASRARLSPVAPPEPDDPLDQLIRNTKPKGSA